ncbi:MAG: TerC/Alx family metal homeostasis membrane protein [Elusimicrobiota bacterium]|jgi:tellurite resistance protein TerC|nr:TerC/Alx family metal homeostasis membrane protein [Elusimicrobiota bacterium]
MDIHQIMWMTFWAIIISAFIVDLFILSKRSKSPNIKSSVKMVCVWISLALLFGAAIYFSLGKDKALEYITAYVVEYSLSIDNMFVFLLIFSYFAISLENQPKVLIYGIAGAVILRFVFIFIGIELINAFSWMIYIFGAILLFTSIKMLKSSDKEMDPGKNIAFIALKKIFPFKSDAKTATFFIKENGILYATPMLAAIVVTNIADIVFAVDSIPAVISITRDAFIVYSSNIFAVLGLRALYFLLADLADKFKLLKYGIAIILFFVGVKMLISNCMHIPSLLYLIKIFSIMALSMLVSLFYDKK